MSEMLLENTIESDIIQDFLGDYRIYFDSLLNTYHYQGSDRSISATISGTKLILEVHFRDNATRTITISGKPFYMSPMIVWSFFLDLHSPKAKGMFEEILEQIFDII